MRRLAVVAMFLVASCGSILAQSHTVSLAFKPGDTYKYKLHVALDYKVGAQGLAIPVQLDLTANDTVTVKSVDASGTADITVGLSDIAIKSTANGTDNSTVYKDVTVDLKVAPDGRIVSVNGNALATGLPDFTGTGSGWVSALLPDGAVKVGDTWTKSYDAANPAGSGTVHVSTANKYVRDEKVGGADTAVIESKITNNVDVTFDAASLGSFLPTSSSGNAPTDVQSLGMKGSITTDITSWIDTSGRRLVKSHSTGSTDATMTINMATSGAAAPGLTGPVTIKGTQTVDINPA